LQCLVASTALGDTKLDSRAGFECFNTIWQCVRTHMDVWAALLSEETEPFICVVPLHFARGHDATFMSLIWTTVLVRQA
jgi:hypothetical protein